MDEFNDDIEMYSFGDWLEYGKAQGWVSDVSCYTHDTIPLTDEEQDEFEEGDPCVSVIRVWF